MQNILIIGAGSAIAKSVARIYAVRHANLFLIGRNEAVLQEQKSDLEVRGAQSVHISVLDANDFDSHAAVLASAFETLGSVDLALICHGTLPDQQLIEHDFERIQAELRTNALSVISMLSHLAPPMSRQRKGCLAVITSVAGDRGRQSNYIYGSAKGMVSLYLQGLRGSLLPHQVHVIDIKPGFVDTPMTQGIKKGLLWAQPDNVAIAIVKGIEAGKNTLYAPWFWRFIMLAVRNIPENLFKRMKL